MVIVANDHFIKYSTFFLNNTVSTSHNKKAPNLVATYFILLLIKFNEKSYAVLSTTTTPTSQIAKDRALTTILPSDPPPLSTLFIISKVCASRIFIIHYSIYY
mmetsp:Transcript_11900/g.16122  ORF Transcript_11900/g.16122 Transcript_11900/m.16122 type:complete len:103 (+) Transcript_11900:816-1124(+)